jgi:hypothetical protein
MGAMGIFLQKEWWFRYNGRILFFIPPCETKEGGDAMRHRRMEDE